MHYKMQYATLTIRFDAQFIWNTTKLDFSSMLVYVDCRRIIKMFKSNVNAQGLWLLEILEP